MTAAAPTASTGTARDRRSRECSRIWRTTIRTRIALITYMLMFMPSACRTAPIRGVSPRAGVRVDTDLHPRVDPGRTRSRMHRRRARQGSGTLRGPRRPGKQRGSAQDHPAKVTASVSGSCYGRLGRAASTTPFVCSAKPGQLPADEGKVSRPASVTCAVSDRWSAKILNEPGGRKRLRFDRGLAVAGRPAWLASFGRRPCGRGGGPRTASPVTGRLRSPPYPAAASGSTTDRPSTSRRVRQQPGESHRPEERNAACGEHVQHGGDKRGSQASYQCPVSGQCSRTRIRRPASCWVSGIEAVVRHRPVSP